MSERKKFFPKETPMLRENGTQFSGIEKRIYSNPDNPKVIAAKIRDFEPELTNSDSQEVVALKQRDPDFGRLRSVRDVKASFYLTKIFHFLFPKNIPDIYAAYTNPAGFIRKKVNLGVDHQVFENVDLEEKFARKEYRDLIVEEALQNLIKIKLELLPQMIKTGLVIEDYNDEGRAANYGRDSTGNPIYIEELRPWKSQVYGIPLFPQFDYQKLKQSIIDKEDTDNKEKEKILRFLDRLQALFKEDERRQLARDARTKTEKENWVKISAEKEKIEQEERERKQKETEMKDREEYKKYLLDHGELEEYQKYLKWLEEIDAEDKDKK